MTNTVPTFNSCTKCEGILAEYTTACPIANQFSGSGHGCMHDLTTEHSFDSQVTWVIHVLGLLFDILSMDVCTTRHYRTSGRLVQELDVCTVELLLRICKYLSVKSFLGND